MMNEKHSLGQEMKEDLGLEGDKPFYEGGDHSSGLGAGRFRLYGVGRHRKQHQGDSFLLYGDEMNPIRRFAPVAAAVVVGGLVIAGAMLLLAPASGRDTGKKIQHKAKDLAKDTVGSVKKAASEVMDKAEDVVSATKKVGKKALHR
ncbi:MAG TPA: YtxH domain-containing protein [Anaerolineales bacterium]